MGSETTLQGTSSNQHTKTEIRRQRQVHQPVSAVLVEDKANGPAVIQRLKADVPEVIAIQAWSRQLSGIVGNTFR